MLTAKNIHKSYGQLPVLKGIDLEIQQAEIVSIVGASGAGKSTLLHILGTLDQQDKGEISYDNLLLSALKEKQLAKFRNQHIGFIYQFHHLLPEFTALENICMPALIAGKTKKEAIAKAQELLSFLNLSERANHRPMELSGGEQQRVAIARAIINKPKAVLADEPSGNLDSKNADELHQLFFRLREEFNQTFIIVTHNNQLAEMADRKIVLKDGKIAK